MGEILQTVMCFFHEEDWDTVELEDMPFVQTTYRGTNGQWTCFAEALEEDAQLVFYSVCPFQVPEHRRQAMAEFVTRANYDLIIGNFELDFVDGEVRYKTSIDVYGDNLSVALVRRLVYSNVLTLDTYLPGILALLHDGTSPAEAIALVEG